MTTSMKKLLLSTALTLPMAAGAQAQTADATCSDLELLLTDRMAEGVPADAPMTGEEIAALIEAQDDAQCAVAYVELERVVAVEGEAATAEAEAQLAETETATVRLEDEVVIEGMVYLEQEQPSVSVESGQTDVMVANSTPDVTVTEGQPEILIRQAPATITMDMPQPTIRIEQPAPEIIITMPDPTVDVANTQPQVEIRQADPVVTVTQARPTVDLELGRAPEGSEGGIQVTDRATGETFATGAAGEARAVENAEVQLTTVEPTVTYEESRDGQNANVSVQRAEPNIRFESAEPVIEFTQGGEPVIEMVQTGEPVVTINEAAMEEQDEAALEAEPAAALDTAQVEEEPNLEAEIEGEVAEGALAVENAAEAVEGEMEQAETAIETEAAEAEAVVEGEVAEAETEMETVEAETAEMTETATIESNGPMIEREGFAMVAANEIAVTDLEGSIVYGINDERIGDIGDIMIDDQGSIQQVIVEVGGFLGIGEKPVAIPFDQMSVLRSEAGEVRVFIEATEEQLESMQEVEQ
ncbi:PRC-barrel domain-containing protein [Limimaricola sp. ASW11-118]|uniref:PRC-barrel domain-containing protein n=1 Tax=Limimaricola litoreus TaxID=2955316 RepID=A0A9X2JNF1_9RHOB|nr:PRC-barrel domain-containing protein [Limimaricola litoreus]MCP1167534.1 PRC-barrel domain-containing protein [Limimaricola litoreus]